MNLFPALILVVLINAANAAEPPVRDGLILHFDASAQGSARQRPVDVAVDTSSRGMRGFQLAADRRPTLISDGGAAYLNFDGKDDFLAFTREMDSAAELTVFVLAAPKSNPGNFSGFFATAASGKNDYTSGFNFDFGPNATKELSVLNVESAGSVGFRDLLGPGFLNASERPFGGFHVFTTRSKPGKGGTEVFLDGFRGGARDRTESTIALEHIVIGARLYSNDGGQPPHAQGFFDGAIAEVLLYNRALSDAERRGVEQALLAKVVGLQALRLGKKGHALETVKDPPVVQMLVPGFTVQELPLKLGNLNNVRYRHDGKLVGLGYDGRIHLLSDSDGDGLEDRAEFLWSERTLRAPIGMELRGDRIFVASKGKVSVIENNQEKVIASGWTELPHGVDTLGLAIDPKDGSVYFGLGCANFVDGYLIDRTTGKARYSLDDIRGTIQRISPDFSGRETICTGVRFTCALAFNEHGDLFATDQEGATWLPNGNPMDELLHIQKGKHYGFPPRHPKHLPDVRDEPAVIEYGPQHQSTVGMVFNSGKVTFGPAHWRGDALVCGESRGKLWRTKLAKTPLGYVAQNHLIACLSLLAVDACVSPQGDLVVACHSGPPDWGTGPAGEGRIFKIRYSGTSLPHPVLAWAAGPDEFRIAFDRPVDPADWAKARPRIEAGQHVSAGDRFEVIRPGYQVVRDQMSQPRRWVDVLGLSFTEDRRAMVLRVPRQTEPAGYAITLPLPQSWRQRGGIAQHPEMDVSVTLNGVLANAGDRRCVLPHPSLAASKVLAQGSAEHEAFLNESKFTLRASIDTSDPFVPAVQPGSKLDWEPAPNPFDVRTDYKDSRVSGKRIVEVEVTNPSFEANGLFLAKGEIKHPLSTARVYVPWAVEGSMPATLAKARADVKGHWLRGRGVFFTDGGCGTCHTIRGEGIPLGPDLSNLVHRDRDSVLQDIFQPSATINPDHAGTMLTLKDGTSLAGIVRAVKDGKTRLGLPAGAHLELAQETISATEPLKGSLMPEGLRENLSVEQVEDLLTFLLTNPLEPAPITRTDPPMPPIRRLSEVQQVLGDYLPGSTAQPLKILLCAGPKDHGPDEHDYPLWLERWSRLLALAENVTVSTATGFPTAGQLAAADVAVFYNANPGWSQTHASALDAYHLRGGGAVYIHYGVDGGKAPDLAAERFGLAFTLGSRFRHGEFDLVFTQPDHPITRNFPTLHFTDETYWAMRGDSSRLNVLGTAVEDKEPRPQLWTLERHRSRIVACIPGHYSWTFDDPLFRILVFRSICWTARQEDPDRLATLALIGARWTSEELTTRR